MSWRELQSAPPRPGGWKETTAFIVLFVVLLIIAALGSGCGYVSRWKPTHGGRSCATSSTSMTLKNTA